MASRKLVVEIVGDSRSLDRTFAKSSRNAKKFEATMAGALGGGGVRGLAGKNAYGAAALAATAGFVKTTQAASNLNEEINKSKTIFGSAAGQVEGWSQTTARGLGIAQTEALRAAGNFGQMFRTIGLGKTEAADMSQRLVGLASDLASFNNQDPSEMLDRLRSGLAGEAEPLRVFGILLSEARVKQEAYRLGIARAGATLTEQQKVQARYSLILKDSSLAQGDFARTSDGLANQQRILKAQFEELTTSIGLVLLPAMTNIITTANDVIGAIQGIGTAVEAIDGLTASIGLDIHVGLRGAGVAALQLIPGAAQIGQAIGALRDRGDGGGTKRPPLVRGETAADKVPAGRPPPPLPKPGVTTTQKNAWFDAMIGRKIYRTQAIKSIGGQIGELKKISRLIEARIKITKDVTRRRRLEDDLLGVQMQMRGLAESAAAGAKSAASDAKALAEERREREKLARESAQFRALGLGPGGADLVPGIPALTRVFSRISKAMKNATPKLQSQTKAMMKGIRDILAGGMGDVSEEVRRKIQQLLAELDKKLGGGTATRRQHFRKASVDQMLAGLGLTPEQLRIATARMAGATGGKVPLGGTAAFGMRVGPGATVVNINGNVVTPDPDKFLRDMQKKASRSRAQQRGVRPGVNLGGA